MSSTQNNKKVTIYDIAKVAKSSASTVGSVLNGSWKSRRISEKLATKIQAIADELGYSTNMQASALRKERSRIIGMTIPMYDNRYFSSIAQLFEKEARSRGLFPIISCTERDPELELATARLMLNYRVELIVNTGATDPDRITEFCGKHGIRSLNLDLPGSKAPSIISDNFAGALTLTSAIIESLSSRSDGDPSDILFIGGRPEDHNTQERVRGFLEANKEIDNLVDDSHILTCGYAVDRAEESLTNYINSIGRIPAGLFVNSTISLEGIIRWFKKNGIHRLSEVIIGCFDWDPFGVLVDSKVIMVKQNVPVMMNHLFKMIDDPKQESSQIIEIKPEIIRF